MSFAFLPLRHVSLSVLQSRFIPGTFIHPACSPPVSLFGSPANSATALFPRTKALLKVPAPGQADAFLPVGLLRTRNGSIAQADCKPFRYTPFSCNRFIQAQLKAVFPDFRYPAKRIGLVPDWPGEQSQTFESGDTAPVQPHPERKSRTHPPHNQSPFLPDEVACFMPEKITRCYQQDVPV